MRPDIDDLVTIPGNDRVCGRFGRGAVAVGRRVTAAEAGQAEQECRYDS